MFGVPISGGVPIGGGVPVSGGVPISGGVPVSGVGPFGLCLLSVSSEEKVPEENEH